MTLTPSRVNQGLPGTAGWPTNGDVAHDAVDAGNPVKTGAKAGWPAIPTLVASADRTNNWSDLAGAQIVRKRPVPMYTALYRLADATAATRILSVALTANASKQVATIYHAASATKRVQVKYASIQVVGATVAAAFEFELQPLSATTAPATGNPAITPGKHDQADGAAEATCLALPTTAGSVTAVNSPVGIGFAQGWGIIANDTNVRPGGPIVLWDSTADGDGKDLIMRATNAEGYAVIARANAATTLTFICTIIFTEE